MKLNNFKYLVFVLLFFFLALTIGCGAAPSETSTTSDPSGETGYPAPGYPGPGEENRLSATSDYRIEVVAPQVGLATVTGQVISERTNKPIVEVPVQLAGVFYEGEKGAFVLDTAKSPATTTDGDGKFVFVDIEARDYVLVIGNVEINDYIIIPEESGRAKIWTAVPGEILDTSSHTILLEKWE